MEQARLCARNWRASSRNRTKSRRRERHRRQSSRSSSGFKRRRSRSDPGELEDLRRKSESLERNLAELGPQIEAAKQRLEFLAEEHKGRLGDYLNQPANARRLFDAAAPSAKVKPAPETRARLLEEWVHRLEERDLLFHVLASYEMRKLHGEYCPPIHLQQLKKAVVNREEAKRVEQILEQFPARKISMKKLEDASRAIRRRSHEDTLAGGPAVRGGFHAAAPRPAQLPARGELDGPDQPGAIRAFPRALAGQQEPLRISASGGRPPGAGRW